MKTLLVLACLFVAGATFAQKKGSVTMEWNFKNLIEGYEHDTKMLVYVDGELLTESSVKNEREANRLEFKVPKGKHQLKIVNYSLYEGNWEIRSIENQYSTDGTVDIDRNFGKKTKILITFDIDNPEPVFSVQ